MPKARKQDVCGAKKEIYKHYSQKIHSRMVLSASNLMSGPNSQYRPNEVYRTNRLSQVLLKSSQ